MAAYYEYVINIYVYICMLHMRHLAQGIIAEARLSHMHISVAGARARDTHIITIHRVITITWRHNIDVRINRS